MLYEIEPGLSINSDLVWKVEVKNKKVEWRTSDDKKEDFDYGSNSAAIAAYDDYIEFVDSIYVSRRDLVAHEALSGIVSNIVLVNRIAGLIDQNPGKELEDLISEKAYEIADAMEASR